MDLQVGPSATFYLLHSWAVPRMKAYRLGAFFRKPLPPPPPLSLRRLAHLSSLPRAASNPRRPPNDFSGDEPGSGSAVYRHALKFQKPAVIKWLPHLANSVSLIGTVVFPLKRVATKDGNFGVYTKLSVQTSRHSNRAFWINLKMWGDIAEVSWQQLKPNDYIYVSGQLGSYTKTSEDGQLKVYHEVIVHEFNYVAVHSQEPGQEPGHQNPNELKSGASYLEKQKERLHLWQLFFANPYEWWDNRKSKLHPSQPDFKHKDTGEALWLNSKDPQWVKKQLELLDSKMQELGPVEYPASRRRVSTWEFDE